VEGSSLALAAKGASWLMPGCPVGGLELLQRRKSEQTRLPAIMITGQGDVPRALAAMKAGTTDLIESPIRVTNCSPASSPPWNIRGIWPSCLWLGRPQRRASPV